ncbi:MAG TPA: acyloxyacyl hydrolase [Gemmataceae bacterium]|jgi:hypothetical protein|nr:acyloxyacyl hydrolase [Gemmataceae bacterium]
MPAGILRYAFALLVIVPAVGVAQSPTAVIPPPMPTGAPLAPLPGQDSGRSLISATVEEPPAAPFLDGRMTAPTGGGVKTDCSFDGWCGATPFAAGTRSCQVLLGGYFSTDLGPPIATFNYIPLTFRHGWMLTDPSDERRWPGNWEFLTDFTVSAITSDYGHWFAGPSFYLRRNFVGPDATLVPYSQLGAGFILNDAYRDKTQDAIGAFFEFYLHLEVGVKYFVSKNLSLDIEGGLQHISNADTAGRNLGVNAVGVQVGLTYYFPSGARD